MQPEPGAASAKVALRFQRSFYPYLDRNLGPMGPLVPTSVNVSGFFVSLALPQYHVLWYGRVDASPASTASGTYTGDEPGVSATLILKPDHTFEQVIHTVSITKQATGSWSVGQNGDINFSKDFLKASGETLRSNETATAWSPKGSGLQIQITMTSKSGVPDFLQETTILKARYAIDN